MKLTFVLEYQTIFGEEIVLNVLADGAVKRHSMGTIDGRNWSCEITTAAEVSGAVDYYYSVERAGVMVRHEWLVQAHRLDLSAVKSTRITTYDHWIDNPENSYLYSSAFTECGARREILVAPATTYGFTVMLKVRAPQLGANQKLAIVGGGTALGNWALNKATAMVEHAHNEWVVTIDATTLNSRVLEFKFVAYDTADNSKVLWEEDGNRTVVLPELKKGDAVVYELDEARFAIAPWRVAGTVVPVFSLRTEGSFGVGDFGDLKEMIDWAASTGQRALQVLPINDSTITGTWQDSYPYNSISIYALHPQYTDLRQLPALADKERANYYAALQHELNALPQIDYERVNAAKRGYLHEIFEQEGAKMMRTKAFKTFFDGNKDWLVPYAAFSHYRDLYGTATFSQWPDHHTFDESEREAMANSRTSEYKKVAFWYFVQFCLDQQMRGAHEYARKKGVILKGDIPIGISRDGVEAWVEPRYFNLNGQAGAPPDAFSTNGQNWGFPTYNWDEMIADGCSWWVKRFSKMAEYFDAYRIDHVLGFFRIWEIPIDAVYGLLGQFSPALGMSREEIQGYGLNFQDYMLEPFITDWVLDRTFGARAQEIKEKYLDHNHDDMWRLKPEYNTQRKIEAAFKDADQDGKNVAEALMSLVSNVLFLRDRKNPNLYHPRISVQHDFIYEALWQGDKEAFNRLYNDYFYRRNNDWYSEAMKKLPRLVEATRMLVCAEDLGMVPDCVPWVIDQLRILSLEIQSMPKDVKVKFGVLQSNPYRSVSTISTHDMPTLRQWWDEDYTLTQEYFNAVLWKQGPAPHPLPGDVAEQVVVNHLNSPSMLCLLSLQDWLSIDENFRLADADAERINIPANPRHYWRYRMHMTISQLKANKTFNDKLTNLIANSGRK
ncbi:MAG: 4-alpha-glucanotransferase [Bacteroidales bacterium]|nr:4-alpha-glucanotransferase [Bacteroidales bacterium]